MDLSGNSLLFRNVLFFDLLRHNRGTGDFVPEDFQWEIMMSWRVFTHVALRYVVRVAVDFLFTMIIYINIHADGSDERQ